MPRRDVDDARPRPRAGRLGRARARRSRGAYPEDLLDRGGPPAAARRRARAPTTASATGCSSSCATSAGAPVGFGGRALSPEGEPKYLNSPESPVFSKKRLLYGLFEAREAIRKHDRVVLVEGYFDHLALVRAGIEETVASMGTALTPEQAEKLRRLCPRAVVCYDGDSGGPQRHARRSAAPARAGLRRAASRGCPQGEDPGRPAPARGPGGARARGSTRRPTYLDLAPRGPPARTRPGLASAEKRERDRHDPRDPRGDPRPDPPLRGVPQARGGSLRAPRSALGRRTRRTARAENARSTGVGTPGNSAVLSAVEAPAAEARLLRAPDGGRRA